MVRPPTLVQDGWRNCHNETVVASCLQVGDQSYSLDSVATGAISKTADNCKSMCNDSIKNAKENYNCKVLSKRDFMAWRMYALYRVPSSWLCIMMQGAFVCYLSPFLAPPAEWQRSFSNAELSVVRLSVCRQLFRGGGGGGQSQKRFSTVFLFLAWSFFVMT